MRQLSLSVVVAAAVVALPAFAQQDPSAPGPVHDTNIVVGESPPANFVLRSLDDESFDLAEADGPLLLLFFRGTW